VTDQITILPAGWHDWPAVYDLEKACFGRDAWDRLELFLTLIGSNVRLKAMVGDRLVGFAMGDPHPAEGYAWIATLGIHPEFQRRGIGARLLAETEAQLTTPLLRLTVRPSNTGAIALYQKFGYVSRQTYERYYADGEAGLVMEKKREQVAGGK